MDDSSAARLATAIVDARRHRRTLDADSVVTRFGGPLDLDDAYRVQHHLVAHRLGQGEQVVGWKLGYTSVAMREQMGVSSPNFGPLTDAMVLSSPSVVPDAVLQPRVEPEIAVRFGCDLTWPCTFDDVVASLAGAWACLEVVDSVWSGYRFRIEDNTADGSSAAFVVLGDRLHPERALDAVEVVLSRNGEEVAASTGAAASGHPLRSVEWLVAELAKRDERLRSGQVVITGGLTRAVPLEPGDVITARFDREIDVEVGRPPVTGTVEEPE